MSKEIGSVICLLFTNGRSDSWCELRSLSNRPGCDRVIPGYMTLGLNGGCNGTLWFLSLSAVISPLPLHDECLHSSLYTCKMHTPTTTSLPSSGMRESLSLCFFFLESKKSSFKCCEKGLDTDYLKINTASVFTSISSRVDLSFSVYSHMHYDRIKSHTPAFLLLSHIHLLTHSWQQKCATFR